MNLIVTIVTLVCFIATLVTANSASKFRPCHLEYPEAEAISAQLKLLTEMYLGHSSPYNDVIPFRDNRFKQLEICYPRHFSEVNDKIRAVMARSWKATLDSAEVDDSYLEELEKLVKELAARISKLSFENRYYEMYTLEPAVLLDSFKTGMRRIKAVDANRRSVEEKLILILQALERQKQEPPPTTTMTSTTSASTTTTQAPPSTTRRTTTKSPKANVKSIGGQDVQCTPEPQALELGSAAPNLTLDPNHLQHISRYFTACSETSALTDDEHLSGALYVADYLANGNRPALYNAVLDSVLTPSPMICTADYVRLAFKVLLKECTSPPQEKRAWAEVKSRFQPGIFQLFEKRPRKIMSVSKPGFGISVSEVSHSSLPFYSMLVLNDTLAEKERSAFRVTTKADGAHFIVEDTYGRSFQLWHLCTKDVCQRNAQILIMPTEDFVLGRTTELNFRFVRQKNGASCKVVGPDAGYWKVQNKQSLRPNENKLDKLGYATVSDVVGPEALFYLAEFSEQTQNGSG